MAEHPAAKHGIPYDIKRVAITVPANTGDGTALHTLLTDAGMTSQEADAVIAVEFLSIASAITVADVAGMTGTTEAYDASTLYDETLVGEACKSEFFRSGSAGTVACTAKVYISKIT